MGMLSPFLPPGLTSWRPSGAAKARGIVGESAGRDARATAGWEAGATWGVAMVQDLWSPTLVCCELRRDDRLRFGGEAVPTRGQSDLSLTFRVASAPLF